MSEQTALALSDDTLWTVPDVAAYLRVSKSWVYQHAADGTLPSLNVGGVRRFDPVEIKYWARGEESAPIELDDRRRRRK